MSRKSPRRLPVTSFSSLSPRFAFLLYRLFTIRAARPLARRRRRFFDSECVLHLSLPFPANLTDFPLQSPSLSSQSSSFSAGLSDNLSTSFSTPSRRRPRRKKGSSTSVLSNQPARVSQIDALGAPRRAVRLSALSAPSLRDNGSLSSFFSFVFVAFRSAYASVPKDKRSSRRSVV
jgi:hypothetical protein